ncbi:hypothetical protein cyc_08746 [Cyclospora cayetanensis]|uniref:Uncharacterized protein n=1 Tax=Cyclospora cayetanensis TaxID=88456 RepID=A0A1D3DAI1_9EIME|nr:hypothetical protein cyc_08746 [Cyclospora cayetanensis]
MRLLWLLRLRPQWRDMCAAVSTKRGAQQMQEGPYVGAAPSEGATSTCSSEHRSWIHLCSELQISFQIPLLNRKIRASSLPYISLQFELLIPLFLLTSPLRAAAPGKTRGAPAGPPPAQHCLNSSDSDSKFRIRLCSGSQRSH